MGVVDVWPFSATYADDLAFVGERGYLGTAPGEDEILLQRGLHYQITDVYRDPDGLWSGTARVLPPGRQP